MIAALDSDQLLRFEEKCRNNSKVRWRIISVSFLSLIGVVFLAIGDPAMERAGTEILMYSSMGVLLFSVLVLLGHNFRENRCPSCAAMIGLRNWPHPDRGSMKFCAKCGADWFPSSGQPPLDESIGE